jgi:hypothetical protein
VTANINDDMRAQGDSSAFGDAFGNDPGDSATSSGGSGGQGGASGAGGASGGGVSGGGGASGGGASGSGGSGGAAGGGVPQCPSATLPGSIDGVEMESMAYHPPEQDSLGNLYRMTESVQDDGNEPRMMKSSDNGATWAEVDRDHRPTAHDLEGTYQVRLGCQIFVSVSTGKKIWWISFNMSDCQDKPDQWSAEDQIDDALSGDITQYSSLARTSDGRFWLAYSDSVVGDRQQIALRQRQSAGTFGQKIKPESDSGEWTGPRLLLGAADVVHLFYADHTNKRIYLRQVTGAGTLSAAVRVDEAGTSSVAAPHTNAVHYQDAGHDVLVVAYADGNNRLMAVPITDGAVGAAEEVSAEAVLQNPPIVLNEGTVASLVLDGTTVHVVWTDKATGAIRLRSRSNDKTWSSAQTLWSASGKTALYVHCGLLRSDQCPRLACVYDIGPHADDTGEIEYFEFVLPR